MRLHVTQSALASALWCCILACCAHVPDELRRPTAGEDRAIGAARQAWDASGRAPTECDMLNRARVALLPHDELQLECGVLSGQPEVAGCLGEVNLTLFDPPSFVIFADEALDAETLGSVVIHEALHGLRACWIDDVSGQTAEYLARYKRGESEGCRIPYGADHFHCDREVWDAIHADAFARWSVR